MCIISRFHIGKSEMISSALLQKLIRYRCKMLKSLNNVKTEDYEYYKCIVTETTYSSRCSMSNFETVVGCVILIFLFVSFVLTVMTARYALGVL